MSPFNLPSSSWVEFSSSLMFEEKAFTALWKKKTLLWRSFASNRRIHNELSETTRDYQVFTHVNSNIIIIIVNYIYVYVDNVKKKTTYMAFCSTLDIFLWFLRCDTIAPITKWLNCVLQKTKLVHSPLQRRKHAANQNLSAEVSTPFRQSGWIERMRNRSFSLEVALPKKNYSPK